MKITELAHAPGWLRSASTIDADVELVDGSVIWHGGTWEGGTWHGGTWEGGIWKGGTIRQHASHTPPVSLLGLRWPILYGSDHVHIGCQSHTYAAWAAMTDVEIDAMHPDALIFWRQYKAYIMTYPHATERGRP